VVGDLRARDEDVAVVLVGVGQRRVGFEVGVGLADRLPLALVDGRVLAVERRLDVAEAAADARHPVALVVVADDLVFHLVVVEQSRRALVEGSLGIEDGFVLLVLDLDGVDGRVGRFGVDGRDSRDRVAHVADVLREDVHVPRTRLGVGLAGAGVLPVGDFLGVGRQDGVDAVHRLGRARVDVGDTSVWNVAAPDRGVGEVGELPREVGGVLRLAGDEFAVVRLLRRRRDAEALVGVFPVVVGFVPLDRVAVQRLRVLVLDRVEDVGVLARRTGSGAAVGLTVRVAVGLTVGVTVAALGVVGSRLVTHRHHLRRCRRRSRPRCHSRRRGRPRRVSPRRVSDTPYSDRRCRRWPRGPPPR